MVPTPPPSSLRPSHCCPYRSRPTASVAQVCGDRPRAQVQGRGGDGAWALVGAADGERGGRRAARARGGRGVDDRPALWRWPPSPAPLPATHSFQKFFFFKVSRDAFLMGPIPRATRAGNFGGLTPEPAPPPYPLPERIALRKGGTRQGNRGPEPPRRGQVATPAGRSRASPCGSRRSMSWAEGARAGGDL